MIETRTGMQAVIYRRHRLHFLLRMVTGGGESASTLGVGGPSRPDHECRGEADGVTRPDLGSADSHHEERDCHVLAGQSDERQRVEYLVVAENGR